MKAIVFIVGTGLLLWAGGLLIPAFLPDAAAVAENDSGGERFSPYVDQDGKISRPAGFRQNWVHMGTWYVPETKQAKGPGFHDVYASPGTVAAYKKTGEFPDGAVLVKEISAIDSAQLTTGDAHWAGNTAIWFVMIKDRKNRFPDNTAWGEGWGWALFKADKPLVNVAHNWKQGTGLGNCYGCHIPTKQTDWVYIEGYPTLRSEK